MDYTDRIPDQEPDNKILALLTGLAHERQRVEQLQHRCDAVKNQALREAGFYRLAEELEMAKKNEQMFYAAVKEEALHTKESLPEEVKVKTFRTVTLSSLDKIKDWCMKNFTPALVVDVDTFEKAVKNGQVPEELGTATEEKRAQVAQNLEKYL